MSGGTTGRDGRAKRAARLFEPNLAPKVAGLSTAHRWSVDGRHVTLSVGGQQTAVFDTASGAEMGAPPVSLSHCPAPADLSSPDGTHAVFVRGNDLWLRSAGREQRLTYDGEPLFAYGALPQQSTRLFVAEDGAQIFPPLQVSWSPDSRRLVGQRLDERHVEPYPYLQSVPTDGGFRPVVRQTRMAMLGEPGPVPHPFLLDIGGAAPIGIRAGDEWELDALNPMWADAGRRLFLLGERGEDGAAGLFEVDLDSGQACSKIIEAGPKPVFLNSFDYQAPNVRVLESGLEAVWWSERDGRGNLYRYNLATGASEGALYDGPGVVLDLLAIDEAGRIAMATIGGSIGDDDPYRRDLFALPLDGGPAHRLTDERTDHAIEGALAPRWLAIAGLPTPASPISPDGALFIDRSSRVDRPTVTSLRRTRDGSEVAVLAVANASEAAGWRPPIRFSAKAADGITDLWGTLWLPPAFDPNGSYPIVDALYGGPQLVVAPRAFHETLGARGAPPGRASLAALGCFVITVDGRGTPGRDRDFREAGYGNFADLAIEDHVAVLMRLAERYPSIDLERVGVVGHSFGGYVAARAMLRRPDLFKVGVSSAGVHNWQGFRDAYRRYLGAPDYGAGVREKPARRAVPDSHRELDNATLAGRLQGRLLLAYGDMDENAMPASTLQFIDALVGAGKRYDLIYVPNGTHGFNATPWFTARILEYFAEHLLGSPLPTDFSLAPECTA